MRRIFILLFCLAAFLPGFGQEFPEPLQPRRMVNDLAGMFSVRERDALEQQLRRFNDTTSTQIAVATVSSLNGYDANDYAQRLAEKWGVGQKGKDNGILILIKPKSAREKGEVAIAVGYGLEGVVPDAIASRIIRNEIIPEFQTGNYYAGVNKAAGVLMQLTAGEYTAEAYAHSSEGVGAGWMILILMLVFIVLPLFLRRHRGYTTGGRGGGVPPIIFGPGRGGGFGSFSSGSGGFGGFGGGGFGGGGAKGSW